MKRVLIIAPDFVPSSLPPATRVRFFAKHLPEFGWEPVVLTVDPKHYEAAVDPENENLLAPSLRVIRTDAFSTRWTRKIGIGDVGMRSLWHHWRALSDICRTRRIDALFIPVPPYVPMILGRFAHARFGISYVIDYIDPWVTEFYWQLPKEQRPPKWRLAYWLARVLEPFALKRVAHITGVSRGTLESVVGRYPRLSEGDATEIPYGAEASDFDCVRQHPRPNSIFDKNDGLIHFSYIGACPPPMHATVRALFAAMRFGLERAPTNFRRLRLHFIGTSYAVNGKAECQVMRLAREAGVAECVTEQSRRISYLDSLQVMLDSQALVMVGSDEPHYTPSKVFPYVLAKRPLLAVFHEESSVVKILRDTNAAEAITFTFEQPPKERVETIVAQLEGILALPRDYEPPILWDAFESYTTRAMSVRLANTLNRAVGSAQAGRDSLRKRFRIKLVTALLATVLAVGIAEVLLRLSNYRPLIMDPNMYVANADPLWPYRLQANYRGFCAGSEVGTDPEGNRVVIPSYQSLYPYSSKPDRTVLLLGDSGVFGFGLPDSDTLASQLQRESHARQVYFDIRNIGVPGYTSWNEAEAFSDYASRHRLTDVVVLYMPNDLTFDNNYFRIGQGGFGSYSRNEDRLHRFLRTVYTHVYVANLLSDGLKRLAGFVRKQKPRAEKFDANASQPQIDYSVQALMQIQKVCEDKQIRFAVGIYRDVAYYDDAQNWLEYERVIKSNLDHVGIASFQVKSHIDKLNDSQARVRLNDPHPSNKAISLIVDDVLNQLAK